MASAVGMMVGGALVNALAFSGSNYLFSHMGKSNDAEKERKRHDKAEEQLQAAQTAWNKTKNAEIRFYQRTNKKGTPCSSDF